MPNPPSRTRSALPALLLATGILLPGRATAQDGNVRIVPSERARVEQEISGTVVSLDYSRPSARGRELFGGQVAFGEFWTGADLNTKIRFSRDVVLGGMAVPAGAYGLWMEPADADRWTVLLLEDTTRYHLPPPSPDDGFVTLTAPVETVPDHQETMVLELDSIRPTGARLRMHWGETRLVIPLEVELGIDLVVSPEAARDYTGEWSERGEPLEAEELAEREAEWSEARMAAYERSLLPQDRLIWYEAEEERLFLGGSRDDEYALLLVRRGEGFFSPAQLVDGELRRYFGDILLEFDRDGEGRVTGYVMRGGDGAVMRRGERSGGEAGAPGR